MAALNAGLGAALVAMAARFTSGKKHEAVEAEAAGVAEACDSVRAAAAALVDEDAGAYDLVTAAYALPKGTDAEKAARAAAVESALRAAMEVPERTIAAAMQALELAASFAPKSNRNLASDVLVGACCLHAAVESARANVRINVAAMSDPARGARNAEAADAALRRAGEKLAAVRAAVEPTLAR